MYPYVFIFGKPFSSYGILAIIGMAAVAVYTMIVARNDKKNAYSRFVYIVYCFLGSMALAAILYQLTNIKKTISALPYLFSDFEKFKENISFGIVFYGGMFGIFVGMLVYTKYFKEDTRKWLRETVPSIPLFHFFGRIGCTVGGCCFGTCMFHGGEEINETLGIFPIGNCPIFKDFCVYNARLGMYCIPIQLLEAFGCLLIFVILLLHQILQKDKNAYYKPIGIYFVLYGILRFVLEFWRGDMIRGVFGSFSTSQYISMIVVPLGIYMLICPTEKNFLEKWYTPGKKKIGKIVQNTSET